MAKAAVAGKPLPDKQHKLRPLEVQPVAASGPDDDKRITAASERPAELAPLELQPLQPTTTENESMKCSKTEGTNLAPLEVQPVPNSEKLQGDSAPQGKQHEKMKPAVPPPTS